MKVLTSLYLWDLYGINEKDENFIADIYVLFKWNDPRLEFVGTTNRVYTENAVYDIFKEIWWPEINLVNAVKTIFPNKTVTIFPNGDVEYLIKVTGTFFSDLNLTKYPFDRQIFQIGIESILWNSDVLQFEVGTTGLGALQRADESTDLKIKKVEALTTDSFFPLTNTTYSNYTFQIYAERASLFFIYQHVVPIFLVLILLSCMFFISVENLQNRLLLAQGSILIFVAMKFIINQELPNINYLTIVDYVFFIAYLSVLITIFLSVIDYVLWRRKNSLDLNVNKRFFWIAPTFFLIFFAVLLYLGLKS